MAEIKTEETPASARPMSEQEELVKRLRSDAAALPADFKYIEGHGTPQARSAPIKDAFLAHADTIERLQAALTTREEAIEECAKVATGVKTYHDKLAAEAAHDVRRWERHNYAAEWAEFTEKRIRALSAAPVSPQK
jgi:hypothetical protein